MKNIIIRILKFMSLLCEFAILTGCYSLACVEMFNNSWLCPTTVVIFRRTMFNVTK